MITAILLALSLASLAVALVAIAALNASKRQAPQWDQCPDCNWFHRGCEFSLELPAGERIQCARRCVCCETLRKIELRKEFGRSAR